MDDTNSNFEEQVKLLATVCGIEPEYMDIWGNRREMPRAIRQGLLQAMGLPVDTPETVALALGERQNRSWRRRLEPVLVVRDTELPLAVLLCLPRSMENNPLQWTLQEEDGTRHQGNLIPSRLKLLEQKELNGEIFLRYSFQTGLRPPSGYHGFKLSGASAGQDMEAAMSLIVAPSQCYMPPALEGNGRLWGPVAQLYALRSQRNWGMGDFTDLKDLVEGCAKMKAGAIGLNPLHSAFPHDPEHASPYSPSSRCFHNVLYVDVEAVPEFSHCQEALDMVAAPGFQTTLDSLRGKELVDYRGVAGVKFSVLEVLHRYFQKNHMLLKTARAREFHRFRSQGGTLLECHALFDALQEYFRRENPSLGNWHAWPEPYGDRASPAVAEFAQAHKDRVEFFLYLQWLAEEQFQKAGERCKDLEMPVGLYRDLAVSVDKGGAEAWANPSLYALDVNIGAPPDEFNLLGQDWGLPPMNPLQLREEAYRPFIQTLRSNMKFTGALRIDHIMGLMRLYWIPQEASPRDGGYVRYPLEDLMGILALESRRNQCLVIGEDLGTVPPEVRHAMQEWKALSYRLFYFERSGDGDYFKRPEDYSPDAVVAVTTHDLPTLSGFWKGRDTEVRAELDLFPNEEIKEQQLRDRDKARSGLMKVLGKAGLLPEGFPADPASHPEMAFELVLALHRFLARTPCKLMMFQFEDILGQLDQVNMPGTVLRHPNWRRKLTTNLENLFRDSRFQKLCAALHEERK